MHICKSVLKYYNFIFYSIRPLAPSRTGSCLYNHIIIHYMTMCQGRWKAFMSKSSTAEPNQDASQSDCKEASCIFILHTNLGHEIYICIT